MPGTGLSTQEAAERLARLGPNALPEKPPPSLWHRWFEQLKSPLVYLLIFAVALDLTVWWRDGHHGWPIEALSIAAILLLSAGLGVLQQSKAEQALARLRELAAPLTTVRRDGQWQSIPSRELVPGDLLQLQPGDRVPADGALQLVSAASFDESVLTGESLSVERSVGETVLAGTLLVRGQAQLEVTQTGPTSNLGQLAALLGTIDAAPTPLERRLQRFGQQIAIFVLILAALLALLGVAAQGLDQLGHALLFGVAVAVAAVPEGLPAVLTLTLALGVERMSARRAIVRKMSAVEALGSVTVIATDKTGTLTENRMEVRALDTRDEAEALRAIVLANDADQGVGDPLDRGLLSYATQCGVDVALVRANHPRIDARPFDSAWGFMRATVRAEAGPVSYLKGSTDELLRRCLLDDDARAHWQEQALQRARSGYRVLALARAAGTAEEGLTLLGLVSFWDPPRPEVAAAMASAHAAGIGVVMITGDHPATAATIAAQIGLETGEVMTGAELAALSDDELRLRLPQTTVFARVRPEQKLRLVSALQAAGEIVAVTGDGVNDAPAIKRSDVGVAMGQRGSDIAREVADIVLTDDNFASVVAAVEEGRSLYENIRKFLRFLFSTNLCELLFVTLGSVAAVALGLRDPQGALLLPLTAAQVLWINLVTDGFPALALALDRNPGLMRRPPRAPSAPLFDAGARRFVFLGAGLQAAAALGLLVLLPRLGFDLIETRTAAFHLLAVNQFLFALLARRTNTTPLPNHTLSFVVAGGIVLQLVVGLLPWAQRALQLSALPPSGWGWVAVTAGGCWLVGRQIKTAN